MVDIAKAVFVRKGHEVEYRLIPWTRTLQMVRAGKVHGAIGPYVDDCPDFVFPKNELAMIGFSAFVKQGSTWRYNGISSLIDIRLGVAADYSYNKALDRYIENNKGDQTRLLVNHGDLPVEGNIKMLLFGRLDAVVATEPVFLHIAKKLNASDQLKLAGIITPPKKAYIAFSPVLPSSKKYAKTLSDGVMELRQSGELQAILSKYGLTDWKK